MFAGLYVYGLWPLTAAQYHKQMMDRIRDKETNMRNRFERRRHAIWWKWTSRFFAVWIGMALVPLLVWTVNQCWLLVLN